MRVLGVTGRTLINRALEWKMTSGGGVGKHSFIYRRGGTGWDNTTS